MNTENRIPLATSVALRSASIERRLLTFFAALNLMAIIAALLFLWPIPSLKYVTNPVTGEIVWTEEGGPADLAGLRVGDRIVRRYDYAWEDLDRQLFLFPLAWGRVSSIPFTIESDGSLLSVTMSPPTPTLSTQLEKLTNTLLALVCWITGYILGLVRRHERFGTPAIAWFWLGISGALGSYLFAYYSSYPLSLALAWVLLSALLPLAVYVHLWFPQRSAPIADRSTPRRYLLRFIALLQLCLVLGTMLVSPSLMELRDLLHELLPLGVMAVSIAVGVILGRAYRRETVSHARRQMRLIAIASSFSAAAWLGLRVLPDLGLYEQPINSNWIDLFSALTPAAYLVGAIVPDLYRIDRVLLRITHAVFAGSALALVLAAAVTYLGIDAPYSLAWGAVGFVALYSPTWQLLQRIVPARFRSQARYDSLHLTAARLSETLDPMRLAQSVRAGIGEAFDSPPLGLYLAAGQASGDLKLMVSDRLMLPELVHIPDRTIAVLDRLVEQAGLSGALGDRVTDLGSIGPGVVLWCPIRDVHGRLLALLLLGMRGDLDPYRAQDLVELRRLVNAAALAFANSAAYAEQVEAEELIRQLYQRLQHAHDTAAQRIAQELHDEALNVNVYTTINALRRIAARAQEPELVEEATSAIEGQQNLAELLRQICERLYPSGIDHPHGLPSVLRQPVSRAEAIWGGDCRLIIEGDARPITPAVQREALRIVREAINNAIKHANATTIDVRLTYPSDSAGQAILSISDDGPSGTISARRGHLGIRNMRENARSAGGVIEFRHDPAGHSVIFSFPVATQE